MKKYPNLKYCTFYQKYFNVIQSNRKRLAFEMFYLITGPIIGIIEIDRTIIIFIRLEQFLPPNNPT